MNGVSNPENLLPDGAWPWLHEAGRVFGRYHARWLYRIRVHGAGRVPMTGPLVVVANHSTFIEPQLLFGMLPRRPVFLVKQELFIGPVGWFLRRLGQVPVRRGAPDRAPLLTAVGVLRAGGLVGIFPEGTRGDGQVATAERGAAWLVRSSGAVVLPVATRGTLRPAHGRRFRRPVDILVGEPFSVDAAKGRSGLDMATEQIRGNLAALVRTLDEWREKNDAEKQKR